MCNCIKTYVVEYHLGTNSARRYLTTVRAASKKEATKAVNKKLANKTFRITDIQVSE